MRGSQTAAAIAIAAAAALLGTWLGAAATVAQGFPVKPIRVLVGFPPGGGADMVARIVGDEMGRGLGQPIVVENKPGATGTVVIPELAKAEPDGHTLLVTPSGYTILAAMAKIAPLDSADGFTWVGNVIDMPFYVLVHDDSEIRSLAALVAAAKAKPATLSYGSAGIGSAYHLLVELIGFETGAQFVHVPYRGDAPIVTDLLGKHIAFAPTTPTGLAGNLEKGRLRALAVTTAKRWFAQPSVPTVSEELGLASFDITSWFSFAGPPRMPKEVVARLNAEIARAVGTGNVRARLDGLGGQVNLMAPEDLKRRAASERKVLTQVADRLGLNK